MRIEREAMLFSRRNAYQIVEGRRTIEFSVRMPRHHKIGRTYAVQVRPDRKGARPGSPIGRVKVQSVQPVHLEEITEADARAAGYKCLAALRRRWEMAGRLWDPNATVYRVEYMLIGPPMNARIAS